MYRSNRGFHVDSFSFRSRSALTKSWDVGVQLARSIASAHRKFMVVRMSWDVIVSKDSTLNGGVSLIGGVSRLVGHWLLFDVIWLDESFSVLTTPWALSFTVVLQMISLPLKSKIVFSNMFKLCSPVQFDSQVQNQVAYISSCWSIWGNVYLRNSCLAHSVSSQRWDKLR